MPRDSGLFDMDVRVIVDEQERGVAAADHGAALFGHAPVERRAVNIALATGTSQFEANAIEINRRKGVILRDW
jgi:hypothetical protein